MSAPFYSEVLVIGAGSAGLTLALRLADQYSVTILAKGPLSEGSSLYAQGGIAAVLDDDEDSFESHIQDTLNAGAGLCHEDAVRFTVEHGPEAIGWLMEAGVSFSCQVGNDGNEALHLTREGGHSFRRVIHAADATGRAIETTLLDLAKAHPNIELHEHQIAVDLITRQRLGLSGPNRCVGAYVLDKHSNKVNVWQSRYVVLATGGASKVYLYTTNPDTSTGDGIAMAWRAGCRVANMEFVQFHPSCLYHPQAKSFLITEAVRGEGGKLTLPDGSSFMERHDERAELAPRDIVARAIDFEMKRHGVDHVNLDISHKPAEFIKQHFPTIYKRTKEFGFDMTKEPLPVVPAAHYTCGGVMTDLNGHTDVPGLYVIGESSFTGLHGANRLASNSLLECLVFGTSAAKDILSRHEEPDTEVTALPPWDESRVTDADERVVVSHNWDELRRFMWDYVGIVRTSKRLERAKHRIDLLNDEIRDYYSNFKITNDLIELRNLVQVAELIVLSAMQRKESRGLHYTHDYPETDNSNIKDTVLVPDEPEPADVTTTQVIAG
ncbi:MAG: L-aspartate oxidase [Proteobacteria bacterium]|nr:L-aspartate oxidase [Pseudomonadota bacterium]